MMVAWDITLRCLSRMLVYDWPRLALARLQYSYVYLVYRLDDEGLICLKTYGMHSYLLYGLHG